MRVSNSIKSSSAQVKFAFLVGAFVVLECLVVIGGIMLQVDSVFLAGLTILPLLILLIMRVSMIFQFFIISLLFTEFYWISVLGGYLKPFHIVSVLLFVGYTIFRLKALRHSQIIILFIFFILVNAVTIYISKNSLDALRSFSLPLLLMTISINVAILLDRNVISTKGLADMILYGSLVLVAFGVLQMVSYSAFNQPLNLTEQHIYQVINASRPPSFFTEADTFGKYLILPFCLFLPFAIRQDIEYNKYVRFFLLVFVLAIFLNMTRSAMIGVGITLILFLFYHMKEKGVGRGLKILFILIAAMLILAPVVLNLMRILGSYDEFIYRFQTLINPSLLLEDGSTQFRRIGVEQTIAGTVSSLQAFFLGHGWGQSFIYIWDIPRDVGGNLFLNIAYYSGIIALVLFVMVCYRILKVFYSTAKQNAHEFIGTFSEGLLWCFVCMLFTSQLASMWIAPEFWLVIGCGVYMEILHRRRHGEFISDT